MQRKSSYNTPLAIYHGVPKGWSKNELLKTYKSLGGKFNINCDEVREPGSPTWLPDRYNWLQYRATMYKISEGVQAEDIACIELAIRYIELDYFGSYSGFIRERLARNLKNKSLNYKQKQRLHRHFQKLIDNKQYFQEVKEYRKLSYSLEKKMSQHNNTWKS